MSSSFYLLLSPEFLGALSSFVVMPKTEDEDDTMLHPELTVNHTKLTGITQNKSHVVTGGGILINKKSVPEVRAGSLTMKCRIQEVLSKKFVLYDFLYFIFLGRSYSY